MSFGGPLLLAPISSLLGVRAGMNIGVLHAPEGFIEALHPLPEGTSILADAKTGLDLQVLFAAKKMTLVEGLTLMVKGMAVNGCLWAAFPTAADAMHTPTEEFVRLAGLELGLVDVKKVMLDPAWVALKFAWKGRPLRPDLPEVRA